eukprot:TRINITY_DN65399_c0_g1_i1.p1 TRINITY_DN65399_c0_g1~~TRINITY_DN65399_c0_g1_i1.p1  ORF type:complete len:291 (-),score=34.42 TRINITY_DN65399_c0_g1_i1:176-1048(-)
MRLHALFAFTALAFSSASSVIEDETEEALHLQDDCATAETCHQVSMLQIGGGHRRARVTPLSGTGPRYPLVVHFIRHGDVHNPNDILYGRMPGFHLSEKGFREAEERATALQSAIAFAAKKTGMAQVSAVHHSPMLRTRETAECLTATSNLSALLKEDPELIEVHVPYNGGPKSEVAALNFDLYSHGQENEGFENYQDVLHRVVKFVNILRSSEKHANTQVVAVTHGDIALTARLWAERGLSALRAGGPSKPVYDENAIPYPGHVSIATLVFDDDTVAESPEWINKESPP